MNIKTDAPNQVEVIAARTPYKWCIFWALIKLILSFKFVVPLVPCNDNVWFNRIADVVWLMNGELMLMSPSEPNIKGNFVVMQRPIIVRNTVKLWNKPHGS